MARRQRPRSVLDSLGEELIRILAPVSICMFLVVILVTILDSDSSSSSSISSSISYIVFSESDSESSWDKFTSALWYSLSVVALVTVVTFVLVLLFYYRCTRFLKLYMGYSSFVVLGFLGGYVALLINDKCRIPIDVVTFLVLLFNFSVVGVLAVFMSKMPILLAQSYLVVIGVFVAYWFTMLPEWTTWVLLVAMALYDLAAVLLPVGPLRILVELAMSRDEEIPALVYEARPVTYQDSGMRSGVAQRRVWRDRGGDNPNFNSTANANSAFGSSLDSASNSNSRAVPVSDSDWIPGTHRSGNNATSLARAEEGRGLETDAELSVSLIDHRMNTQPHQQEELQSVETSVLEGIGLGSSGAIKLGLGDFIFYSVLVGRAAMYDYMTVYACYLAIITGLGITLMLLALYRKALPALPVSVLLGVAFYFMTRLLLEPFVVKCSLNLLMF